VSLTSLIITGIPTRSVNRILSEVLNKVNVSGKWIPHQLSADHKVQRCHEAENILTLFNCRSIQKQLIITDEKWIYLRSVPPKETSRFWIDAGGDRPHIVRRSTGDKKYLLMMSATFDATFYWEILEDGGSINAERYISFIEKAFLKYSEVLNVPVSALSLMHDNARPHIATKVQDFLEKNGVTMIKQPPYSPDFNLLDRFVFRNYETFRKNIDFEDIIFF